MRQRNSQKSINTDVACLFHGINHVSRLILVRLEKFSSISVNIIVPFGEKEFFDDVILALFKESNQLYEKLE